MYWVMNVLNSHQLQNERASAYSRTGVKMLPMGKTSPMKLQNLITKVLLLRRQWVAVCLQGESVMRSWQLVARHPFIKTRGEGLVLMETNQIEGGKLSYPSSFPKEGNPPLWTRGRHLCYLHNIWCLASHLQTTAVVLSTRRWLVDRGKRCCLQNLHTRRPDRSIAACNQSIKTLCRKT